MSKLAPESQVLDAAARTRSGVASVDLPDGATAYELGGPDGAPVAVLLHGGTVPSWSFDDVVPALHGAGLRTLRYDLYGRGLSARPAVTYDIDLYRRQLLGLLDALGLEDPVHLVGFSMGGAIATHTTALHPERVGKLALLAPVVRYRANLVNILVARTPGLGSWFMAKVGITKIVERAEALFAGSPHADRYRDLFAEQISYRGFQGSLRSMLAHALVRDYRPDYDAVGRQGREVLLLWGTVDGEISPADVAEVRARIPGVRFRHLPGYGHGLIMQAAPFVNEELVRFLGE